jgi:hypothetical protein
MAMLHGALERRQSRDSSHGGQSLLRDAAARRGEYREAVALIRKPQRYAQRAAGIALIVYFNLATLPQKETPSSLTRLGCSEFVAILGF